MRNIILFLSVVVTGCSTTPQSFSEAKQAPSNRLYAYQLKTPQTTGTIVVTRDTGLLGSGCYSVLAIDGVLAARFDVGESSTFFVVPGEVLLKVGRDPMGNGLCALERQSWTQRETLIRPHETKYFRLSMDTQGKSDVQRSDP